MWVFRCRSWEASPRFIAELSRMLLDGGVGNPRRDAHSVPAIAGVERYPELSKSPSLGRVVGFSSDG